MGKTYWGIPDITYKTMVSLWKYNTEYLFYLTQRKTRKYNVTYRQKVISNLERKEMLLQIITIHFKMGFLQLYYSTSSIVLNSLQTKVVSNFESNSYCALVVWEGFLYICFPGRCIYGVMIHCKVCLELLTFTGIHKSAIAIKKNYVKINKR